MRLARLTQRKEFLAAAEHGRRFRSSAFMAQVRDAAPDEARKGGEPVSLRLGLTASRKTGNAVKRNRIRRRLRAAAHDILPLYAKKGVDYVLIGRHETADLPYGKLCGDLKWCLKRLSCLNETA